VLGAQFAQVAFHLPSEVNVILNRIDFFVCLVFFTDFCVRLHRAPSKLAFMKWGWIDLVSSVPTVAALRWGRLVRVFSIIRMLRTFRSMNHIVAFLYRERMKSLMGTVILTGAVLVVFSSTAILSFETAPNSNIRTPFDAVWWAFTTMTTTGYGDKFPVTVEGKIVAMVLMVTGVALFGVLTGLFVRLFMETEMKKEDTDINRLAQEVRLLREQIDRMQRGG
jgi:voltage-gated potassium channel